MRNLAVLLFALGFAMISWPTQGLAESHKTRVGVIGLVHGHCWSNLQAIYEMDSVELVGIVEPHKVLHKYAQEIAPQVPLLSTFDELLERKPEIVWSFVENNRHLEIAKLCAPHGIHLIFEKPLASTLSDAEEIRRLAEEHSIEVLTNYQMAWWPTTHAAYAAVTDGQIGEIWRLRGIVGHGGPGGGNTMDLDPAKDRRAFFLSWLNDREKNGGGAIMDFGCYGAVWANWYLGKPDSVWANTNLRKPEVYKVDDNAVIVCNYKRGVAILEGSWSLPRSFQDVEIFGTFGSITATRDSVEMLEGRKRGAAPVQLKASELPKSRASAVAYLIDCMRNNRSPEGIVALDINVDVVEVIEAAHLSVESGKTIPLPLKR